MKTFNIPLSFLLLFFGTASCHQSFAQGPSSTLTFFQSEADFLASVSVASTETFDGFPTDMELDQMIGQHPYYAPIPRFRHTTIDEVIYWAIDECPCTPWQTTDSFGNVTSVSQPNLLVADGWDIERVQSITFGSGKWVEAIGFDFLAEEFSPPDPQPDGWAVYVVERNGPAGGTLFELDYAAEKPAYMGFQSTKGIEAIMFFDNSGVIFDLPSYWAYDNVSRSEVVPEPAGAVSLLIAVLFLFCRR